MYQSDLRTEPGPVAAALKLVLVGHYSESFGQHIAFTVDFRDGKQSNYSKGGAQLVRAVRTGP
jgi:hypothetical protein